MASLEFYGPCRLLAIGCLEHDRVFLLFLFRNDSVCKCHLVTHSGNASLWVRRLFLGTCFYVHYISVCSDIVSMYIFKARSNKLTS